MAQRGCPEKSVTIYQSKLRNIPESEDLIDVAAEALNYVSFFTVNSNFTLLCYKSGRL